MQAVAVDDLTKGKKVQFLIRFEVELPDTMADDSFAFSCTLVTNACVVILLHNGSDSCEF